MTFHSPGHDSVAKNGENPYAGGSDTPADAAQQKVKKNHVSKKKKNARNKKRNVSTNGANSGAKGAAGGAGSTANGSGAGAGAAAAGVTKPGEIKVADQGGAASSSSTPAGASKGAEKAGAKTEATGGASADPKAEAKGGAQVTEKTGTKSDVKTGDAKATNEAVAANKAAGDKKTAGDKKSGGTSSKFADILGLKSSQTVKGADTTPGPRVVEERSVVHVDPISALKMGFLLGATLFAVWIVAAIVLFLGLEIAGVWDRLNSLVMDLTGMAEMGFGLYFGVVMILGLIELVIITLFAPVAAIAYNASATLLGGLRVKIDN